jgi:PAS domain-containing protein
MHDVNPELTAEVMSAMLAASPDCIKILSAGGDILYVNARGAELMQLDRVDDLIGLNYLDLWLAHDHERIAGASNRRRRAKRCVSRPAVITQKTNSNAGK